MPGRATVLCAWALAACGGTAIRESHPNAEVRALEEARVFEIVQRVIQEFGASPSASRRVEASGLDGPFQVDVGVAGHPVAIEYVTDADRVRLSAALPRRTPGALRILGASEPGSGRAIDVLVLEDVDYRYDAAPVEGGSGAPTVQEVEGRLSRDVRDFLQYERSSAGNL